MAKKCRALSRKSSPSATSMLTQPGDRSRVAQRTTDRGCGLVGADIVTAGLSVFKDAFDHPYTGMGLQRFQEFWDKTPYE